MIRKLYNILLALHSQLSKREDLSAEDRAVLAQAERAMKEWREHGK